MPHNRRSVIDAGSNMDSGMRFCGGFELKTREGEAMNGAPLGNENEDHTVIHCRDISDVKAKLDEMSETLNTLAVQEQKISNLFESINNIRRDLTSTTDRVAKLQTDHDRCHISTVSADMAWVKWFVMGNTMTNLALVLGLVTHYIKN